MKIQVHRSNGVNLKMFLDILEFNSVWNSINEDWDELQVFAEGREDLIQLIQAELERTGYLPYHYLLTPEKDGDTIVGESVEFRGRPTQIVNLKNISGNFRIILFEDGRTNYVWKTYSQRELEPREYLIKAQVVCQLKGKNGENFCLINLPRFK